MAKYLTCEDAKIRFGDLDFQDVKDFSWEESPDASCASVRDGSLWSSGTLEFECRIEVDTFNFKALVQDILGPFIDKLVKEGHVCWRCRGRIYRREQRVKMFPGGGRGVYVHKFGCLQQYKAPQKLMLRGVLTSSGKLVTKE